MAKDYKGTLTVAGLQEAAKITIDEKINEQEQTLGTNTIVSSLAEMLYFKIFFGTFTVLSFFLFFLFMFLFCYFIYLCYLFMFNNKIFRFY